MLTSGPTRSRWVVPRATTVTLRARSDGELLLDVAAGDHHALAGLYDHLAGLVYVNVRRALHDATRTDTVAEEAFFEVWRQAPRFDPARTPAVLWVLDLTHQLATEHNRYDISRASAGPVADREPHPVLSASF